MPISVMKTRHTAQVAAPMPSEPSMLLFIIANSRAGLAVEATIAWGGPDTGECPVARRLHGDFRVGRVRFS